MEFGCCGAPTINVLATFAIHLAVDPSGPGAWGVASVVGRAVTALGTRPE